jgi:hypothetical protein
VQGTVFWQALVPLGGLSHGPMWWFTTTNCPYMIARKEAAWANTAGEKVMHKRRGSEGKSLV